MKKIFFLATSVLFGFLLIACGQSPLNEQKTSVVQQPVIPPNADWVNKINEAKNIAQGYANNQQVTLIDIGGGYKKDINFMLATFIFADNQNNLYAVDMEDANRGTTFTRGKSVAKFDDVEERKKLIPLISISPVDVLNNLRTSKSIDEDCLEKVIIFGSGIPQSGSNYPSVPYWNLSMPTCKGHYLIIDVNAQSGNILGQKSLPTK